MTKLSEDFALLSFDNGVLYNNVFSKGDIQNASQQVFLDADQFGWEWNWPEGTGPSVKTYPEIISGRSPWSKAQHGSQLPCALDEVRYVLDFGCVTEAQGSWSQSLDFWITNRAEVLLSGDHAKIRKWREAEAEKRTARRRPDLSRKPTRG